MCRGRRHARPRAETEELVGPVVFLLSAAASYCTGANFLVDGGAVAW
ncbi:SDR family oxidoreductase [Actinomycetospora sp. NBRC 106375]|nr:SDR family oxidoreductase [Actinomycetospora sp. NBRC 106375]